MLSLVDRYRTCTNDRRRGRRIALLKFAENAHLTYDLLH